MHLGDVLSNIGKLFFFFCLFTLLDFFFIVCNVYGTESIQFHPNIILKIPIWYHREQKQRKFSISFTNLLQQTCLHENVFFSSFGFFLRFACVFRISIKKNCRSGDNVPIQVIGHIEIHFKAHSHTMPYSSSSFSNFRSDYGSALLYLFLLIDCLQTFCCCCSSFFLL